MLQVLTRGREMCGQAGAASRTRLRWLLSLAFSLVLVAPPVVMSGQTDPFLNQFAIRLKTGDRLEAENIAKEHGFRVVRELKNIQVYLLEHPKVNHRSKRSADNELTLLQQDARIAHAQQEVALTRVKRRVSHDKQKEFPIRNIVDENVFYRYLQPSVVQRDNVYESSISLSDPKFKDMWYLVNDGQSGGERGLDLNVAVVWENGVTGQGVVVTILDDGVDHTHPDLVDNFDPKASTDLNDRDDTEEDPMPDMSVIDNSHGTRCAGEIASQANNDVCGVGVAYNAKIGGVRILDGTVTDAMEAEALIFNYDYIHIYSASWGPNDDGGTMEGPRQLALEALMEGVRKGRDGKGSIYVWATGNGGMNGDDCSADGYVSRPETLSVGSVTDWGTSPFFMENCTSTLAVVPSGGEEYRGQEKKEGKVKLKVVTTDVNGGCIENFQGTSSAAPLAAGCLANVLSANMELTWRDVQHIVVRGTRIPSADSSWTINGAGHHVSHRFGFGLMDCGKMVSLAQDWNLVPERLSCNTTRKNYQILPRGGKISDHIYIKGCGQSYSKRIDRLEHVQIYLKMSTEYRGTTKIVLTSPSGTRSNLLSPRQHDVFGGEWEFGFMTVHSWDENPSGRWDLDIYHKPFDDSTSSESSEERESDEDTAAGFIREWSLGLFGTHGTRHDRSHHRTDVDQHAYTPDTDEVLEIKKKEVELSKNVHVKRSNNDVDAIRANRRGGGDSEGKDDLEDAVIQELWNLLYGHGANQVKRKRVLQDSPAGNEVTHSSKQHPKRKVEDLSYDELVDEVIDLLEKKIDASNS